MNQAADATLVPAAPARTVLGQPRGLVTLFMTEMWERFTFYGMRAVLILFMVAAVKQGGLGFDDKTASAVYGLYLGGTYLLGLFGGWVADRLLGAQRAVLSGGLLITLGNAMLALGNTPVFFLGLLVIVMGVGLLKPNVSAMVAALYPEGGSRRDAGFSFWAMLALGVAYFVYLLFFARLTRVERNRVLVMVALVAASVMFWAGYEQAGASFNLFADRYTDRHVLGWDMPAGVLQGVNPLFIIVFAPVFAALWIALGKGGRYFNAAAESGAGLIQLGLGFIVMYFASQYVLAGETVLPTWLVLTYLLHSFAELCLSPVGLSYMTKLAPPRFVGQVMGVWFLSLALGSNLAGQLTGQYDATHLQSLPALFLKIFWYGVIGGAVMVLLTPFVKRMMAGVR